ncbi:META domain-containing protein [Lacinutrix iliipiscaria]|uniref:META domain-containing protein n=1 Tax=Lacinutrix iliipiscaria TaxID=1230532 RepID=A0ABW5WN84_9FLAO
MKLITILLTVFVLESCGSSKATANMQDNTEMKSTEILSGTYKIDFIENSTELPEELSITFDETTNTVSGYSGCNNFTGSYSLEGHTIKFGALATTKRMCKRFMDVEQNMLNTLTLTETYTLENGVLNFHNSKTALLKAHKKMSARIAQEDDYIIEYIAETRGSYKMISVKNNTVSYSNQRGIEPTSRTCSENEIKAISEQIKSIELDKLSTLEAPSNHRFTDAAAIGKFKITHNGTTYEVPQFDDGNPNIYIAELVKTMTSMMEKQ